MTTGNTEKMDVDTGQNDNQTKTTSDNRNINEKVPREMMENHTENDESNECYEKGVLLEMEYKTNQVPEDELEVEQIAIEHSIELIEHWVKTKAIDGIKSHEGTCKQHGFEVIDDWLYPIKLV